MYLKNYEDSKANGLNALALRLTPERLESFEKRNQMLETGTGSRSGCLLTLPSDCNARALLAFYQDGDISNMKRWFFLSAKASIMWIHEVLNVISAEDFLWALVSDNKELIDWHCANQLHYESLEKPDNKTIITSHHFARLQTNRALNHEWDALAADCRRALAQRESFKRELAPRVRIFEYWLALATGDKDTMRRYLLDLCTPKYRYRSFNFESPFSNHFIVSYATLYAKLAWRAGYELELDTPWIPRDWLPVQPLEKYEEPWPFMQSFDIWQPFAEPYCAFSPQRPK